MTEEKKKIVFDDGRIKPIAEFQSPEDLYKDLISRVKKYHPSDDDQYGKDVADLRDEFSKVTELLVQRSFNLLALTHLDGSLTFFRVYSYSTDCV